MLYCFWLWVLTSVTGQCPLCFFLFSPLHFCVKKYKNCYFKKTNSIARFCRSWHLVQCTSMYCDCELLLLLDKQYSTDRNSRNSFSPFHLMFIKAICCYSKGLDDRVMWKTIAIKVSCRVEIASCKNCEKKNLLYLFIIVNNFKVVCGNFELHAYKRCNFL